MPRSSKSSMVPHKSTPPAVIKPQGPSFFQTIQEGLAFGVGSSVARNIVDRVLQPSLPLRSTCLDEHAAFDKCILTHNEVGLCLEENDRLKRCISSR
jgi:hypothetical protein